MTIISDGAFVRLCQERAGLKVDGMPGSLTLAAYGIKASTAAVNPDQFVRLFQGKYGLKIDGWAGRDTVATLDLIKPPASVPTSGLPDRYWPLLSKIESGGRPYVQAATSSASGLYQFIRSTWQGEGGKWGATLRPAFGGLRPSAEEQTGRAKTFTAKNADYLRRLGVPINCASLYAAHFLGKVTAGAILAAGKSESAGMIAGSAATDANPSILRNKTVGDFLDWLEKKTGERAL